MYGKLVPKLLVSFATTVQKEHDSNSKSKQAQLGVPHSEIQVELDWQPNWQDVWELGRGGTPHIPFEVIWSDFKLGWGHRTKVLEQLGWGHRTTLKVQIQEPDGWVGWFVKFDFIPTLALIRAQLGFRIQVLAECGNLYNNGDRVRVYVRMCVTNFFLGF